MQYWFSIEPYYGLFHIEPYLSQVLVPDCNITKEEESLYKALYITEFHKQHAAFPS